ncbi:MAG: response regulator [Deltaproteobacteria bacterium]|nr:response regulator [Deltaproteobacteria bacterium]
MKKPEAGASEAEKMAYIHHAVMNPLTVVVGYAQLLASRSDLKEDALVQANRILEQARECVRIIEELTTTDAPLQVDGDADDPLHGEGQGNRTRHILVVDDEPLILKLTQKVLGADYEVAICPTAREAQRRLLIEDYDLVLLDYNLKGEIDGRRLFETLKRHQPEIADKVLFMSGGVSDPEDQDFLGSSGRGCIDKPFNIDKLRETVARAIS